METFTEIYRFFDKEQYADRLADGYVWIGTLEGYRNLEDAERGDKHEAIHTYNSGSINGDGTNSDLQIVATRLNMKISENCKSISINNCIGRTSIKDAFILCTTKSFNPDDLKNFGKYCIKIKFPDILFKLIAEDLFNHQEGVIPRSLLRLNSC